MDEVTNKVGIPIELENRIKEGWVDGRLLHQELKPKVIKSDFHHWFRAHCKRFALVNGVDYCIITSQQRHRNRSPVVYYYLSPSSAEKITTLEQRKLVIKNIHIKTFYFGEHKLRATLINGKLWFFIADTNNIFNVENRSKAIRRMEFGINNITIIANIGDTINPRIYQLVDIIGLHYIFFRTERRSDFLEACNWLVYELMPQVQKAFPREKISVFSKVFHFFKSFTGGAK